jgi:hypothetical protein
MTPPRSCAILRVVCALLVGTACLAGISSAQDVGRCTAHKQRCAGRKVRDLLACHATASLEGSTADARCLEKARTKFDDPVRGCFAKLEARRSCGTVGDAAMIESKLDQVVADVVGALDPALRFEDIGFTVIDHLTGLEWEKKRNRDGPYVVCPGGGISCDDPHDADNIYSWSASRTAADGSVFTIFLGGLNDCSFDGLRLQVGNAGFAGHCDWRLPTLAELRTIVDLGAPGCGSGAPCIVSLFGDTSPDHYWSSSTSVNEPLDGYGVNFYYGSVADGTKTGSSYVRAVRGGR